MGIRDKPIAPGSPWQNAFAERLIGSIRRECVDQMVVLGEAHSRRVLKSYTRYYNESRIHRSLSKDAPFPRAIERLGVITSRPVLRGLHHQYCRILFSVHRSMAGYGTSCHSTAAHHDGSSWGRPDVGYGLANRKRT
jgi:Integrase core domain